MCYANTISTEDTIHLSAKEQALLIQLALAGEASVAELRDRLYAGRELGTDPTSWVRNTLRRPVRAGLIAWAGRGQPYKLTPAGEAIASELMRLARKAKAKADGKANGSR